VSSRTIRVGLVLAALVVTLDGAAAYQLGVRAHRPPSFSRGGKFGGGPAPSLPADRPLPYSPADGPTTTTTVVASTASSTEVAPIAAPEQRTAVGAPATAEIGATFTPPALGTYTYAVEGTESATGFGQRRLPEAMTTTISADPDGPASNRVLDLTLSDQHEEREIVSFDGAGASFVYEAGSVTFGPYTQTSEADYDPAMVQIPAHLAPGVVVRGTTDAGTRVEDWTVTVQGRERVRDLDTWLVTIERQSRPGTAEQVTRSRTYWFAPTLGTWVQMKERMHASRDMAGASFDYDCEYTATLQDVR
jgi:hypothetical protein